MNKEETKEYMKRWFKDHPENIKRSQKIYYKNNREKRLNNSKQWAINNYERVKELARDWRRGKWETDLKYKLTLTIFTGINVSTKKNIKGRLWESLVGYTLNDLIKRLKSTIPDGYTWGDYINGKLQIDHIVPVSSFNYTKPEHLNFKECWGLDNLRLLPEQDNKMKRTSLIKPFQSILEL